MGNSDQVIEGAIVPTDNADQVIEGEMMPPETELTPNQGCHTMPEFASWITASWRTSMEGILETGRRLVAAKNALEHGEWQEMVANHLPFGDSVAARLKRIAESPHFSNPAPVQDLPHSYSVLYEILGFSLKEFNKFVEAGLINKDTTRSEIIDMKRALRNPANPDKKYSGTRSIQQPTFHTLRLTHGEAALLRDLLNEANYQRSAISWVCQRFGIGSKDRPDPHGLERRLNALNLPPLPIIADVDGLPLKGQK
jgi:hypothetical protein